MKRITNLLKALTSKRYVIAIAGIVLMVFLGNKFAMGCVTLIIMTAIIADTIRGT
ncbi:MAG: hypothetical protein BAJALOKI1v1_2690004 [Promethearchaeota archaeon]|nr:MAG: hypothetical protein BAJALOKI1v1_2690004 [Candidatus Lokiarchaeota archaeon]